MNKIKIQISSVALGLTAMVSQIIIIKELLVVFYGNELCLGIILASWLFWTGIGSFIAGFVKNRFLQNQKLAPFLQIAISIILPLNIFLIRIIKFIFKIPAGEIIGFMPMCITSFISTSLICTFFGFTFVLLSKLYAQDSPAPSKRVGTVYLLEGIGACIGGLLYSFLFIKLFTPFQNIFIVSGLNLCISLVFFRVVFQIISIGIILGGFLLNLPQLIENVSRNLQFKPLKLIESINSLYGNISVTKIGGQYSVYENGFLIATKGDALTSEESVHYPMLEHLAPKNILLISGGINGSLDELLKYHVEKIDYVEIDPLLIPVTAKYIELPQDERINLIHMDARLFIKKLARKNTPIALYDVIIINMPDPYSGFINRFYSVEFFKEAKHLLKKGGILSFALSSSENYLSPERIVYLSCIYNTLKKAFLDIKLLPGESVTFLATDTQDLLTYDPNLLIQRLKERKIQTRFVKEYYLPFKLHPLRIQYVEKIIKDFRPIKINQDFKPIGYFYNMLLWLSLFKENRGLIPYLNIVNIYLFMGIAGLVFICLFVLKNLKKSSLKIPIAISAGTIGMSSICFQIVLVLAFQSLYGYMYYMIGLILTAFMAGLVLGSFFITKNLSRIKNDMEIYTKTQLILSIFPIMLGFIFIFIAKLTPDLAQTMQILFILLPVICGFMGGFQFILANKIYSKESKDIAKSTAVLYGIDLLGSCAGGVLAGVLLIPVIGIIETCILLGVINLLTYILLTANRY